MILPRQDSIRRGYVAGLSSVKRGKISLSSLGVNYHDQRFTNQDYKIPPFVSQLSFAPLYKTVDHLR